MASKVKLVEAQATPTADSTQRISTKTRFGVSAILGGAVVLGTGAAIAQYGVAGGIAKVVGDVADFLKTNVTQAQIVNVATQLDTLLGGYGTQVALGAAALATGAAIGGATGKVTAYKASLNDVKARLGVEGSDLNFSQIHRIADVAVKGGIFSGRSIAVQFKEDAVRISNLNRELTNTEFSLSSNAHNTSKARGIEDRFFDLEGGRLASQSASSDDFVASLKSLKSAVNAEVKATDKYTFQKGNSSTAISRREYILTGIVSFAYQRGIAGNFLTAAVKERAETAKSNPKLADVNFRKAIQKGIAAGILAPHVDPKCYDGMVKAAAVASLASTGKNPDAVISSIFDTFKEAGLVDSHLRARFINDVRTKLLNPEAEIADPVARQSTGSSLIDKVRNQGSSSEGSELQSRSALEDGLDAPAEETSSQRKARLAAEAEAQATSDVNLYSDTLASLDPRQKQLADLYETLIKLLNEKTIPLDKIMEMDTRKLRGALAMRHKQGFDLFDQYEANDAAIAATREQIAALTDEIDASRSPRPENFKLAGKPQRKAAEALEKQVKSEDSRIASLSKKAQRANAKIEKVEGTLEENEGIASTFLYPATEQALEAPVVPVQPGFFARLFSRKKTEEEVQVEGAVAVEIESGLEKPNTVSAQAQPEEGIAAPATDVAVEDGIPEPVVEAAKPKWKFWG